MNDGTSNNAVEQSKASAKNALRDCSPVQREDAWLAAGLFLAVVAFAFWPATSTLLRLLQEVSK